MASQAPGAVTPVERKRGKSAVVGILLAAGLLLFVLDESSDHSDAGIIEEAAETVLQSTYGPAFSHPRVAHGCVDGPLGDPADEDPGYIYNRYTYRDAEQCQSVVNSIDNNVGEFKNTVSRECSNGLGAECCLELQRAFTACKDSFGCMPDTNATGAEYNAWTWVSLEPLQVYPYTGAPTTYGQLWNDCKDSALSRANNAPAVCSDVTIMHPDQSLETVPYPVATATESEGVVRPAEVIVSCEASNSTGCAGTFTCYPGTSTSDSYYDHTVTQVTGCSGSDNLLLCPDSVTPAPPPAPAEDRDQLFCSNVRRDFPVEEYIDIVDAFLKSNPCDCYVPERYVDPYALKVRLYGANPRRNLTEATLDVSQNYRVVGNPDPSALLSEVLDLDDAGVPQSTVGIMGGRAMRGSTVRIPPMATPFDGPIMARGAREQNTWNTQMPSSAPKKPAYDVSTLGFHWNEGIADPDSDDTVMERLLTDFINAYEDHQVNYPGEPDISIPNLMMFDETSKTADMCYVALKAIQCIRSIPAYLGFPEARLDQCSATPRPVTNQMKPGQVSTLVPASVSALDPINGYLFPTNPTDPTVVNPTSSKNPFWDHARPLIWQLSNWAIEQQPTWGDSSTRQTWKNNVCTRAYGNLKVPDNTLRFLGEPLTRDGFTIATWDDVTDDNGVRFDDWDTQPPLMRLITAPPSDASRVGQYELAYTNLYLQVEGVTSGTDANYLVSSMIAGRTDIGRLGQDNLIRFVADPQEMYPLNSEHYIPAVMPTDMYAAGWNSTCY